MRTGHEVLGTVEAAADRLPLEETSEAYRLIEEREPGVIKVALAPAS
jgi:hypothetical protein